MSNCDFSFNFLALVLSEILGGPKFTLGGPTLPSGEFFFTESKHFAISNCVFNFNILPLVVSEILGGPIFKLGEAVPPVSPCPPILHVSAVSTGFSVLDPSGRLGSLGGKG